MPKAEKSKYAIQAVSHALMLLEQFHGEVSELGVTSLSRSLDLDKNNVFRLLATLELHGYIEQSRTAGSYRLGLKALELGQTFLRQTGLQDQSRPVLERLSLECHETMYVAILKGSSTVYLDVVETDLPVRVVPRVGEHLPAYCTAAGKVQLAYMTEEQVANFLPERLESHTPNTKKHLLGIARQGYAIDDEELDAVVRCISAPLRDHTRRIIGAVSISGPTMRFYRERMDQELIPLMRRAGQEISLKLGYHDERRTVPRLKLSRIPALSISR